MTKMFGPMTADELISKIKKLEDQLASNPGQSTDLVCIAKGALVALFTEYRDILNKKFFYELGKTLKLDENRKQALDKVPEKYRQDFEEGANERKELIMHQEKCETCAVKIKTIHTPRGRIYMARHK